MPSRAASPRTLAPLLMALALVARMLVPAGFMPMALAGGTPGLVLCSGSGPMLAMDAMPGMAHHAPEHDRHDGQGGHDGEHACPFAPMAAAAALAAPAPLPAIAPVPPALPSPIPSFARPGLGLAAPPPPKTGPPRLA